MLKSRVGHPFTRSPTPLTRSAISITNHCFVCLKSGQPLGRQEPLEKWGTRRLNNLNVGGPRLKSFETFFVPGSWASLRLRFISNGHASTSPARHLLPTCPRSYYSGPFLFFRFQLDKPRENDPHNDLPKYVFYFPVSTLQI